MRAGLAFNCCCQLINFNYRQLATECSGKCIKKKEGVQKKCMQSNANWGCSTLNEAFVSIWCGCWQCKCYEIPLENKTEEKPKQIYCIFLTKWANGQRIETTHSQDVELLRWELKNWKLRVENMRLTYVDSAAVETNALSWNFIHKDFYFIAPASKRRPQGAQKACRPNKKQHQRERRSQREREAKRCMDSRQTKIYWH